MKQSVRISLLIFVSWFFGSLFFGIIVLFALRPLAGLFFLIVVTTLLAMTVAPAIHIVLRHRGVKNAEALQTAFIGIFLAFFILVFTGWFNFT